MAKESLKSALLNPPESEEKESFRLSAGEVLTIYNSGSNLLKN
jgi:hypothetical protein